jgi:hypothetical protein
MHVPVDLYVFNNIMLGCVREQKAYGLQWVEAIGVANKNTVFATLVALPKDLKHNEASFSTNLLCL